MAVEAKKSSNGRDRIAIMSDGAIVQIGSGMDFSASWGPSIGARVDSWVDWLKVNEATAWVLNQIKELLLRVMVNLEDALLWITLCSFHDVLYPRPGARSTRSISRVS